MARCGHCGARNVPTVPFDTQTGQALAPHSPPWARSSASKCKGQETYLRTLSEVATQNQDQIS
jgi:hypothetical protein